MMERIDRSEQTNDIGIAECYCDEHKLTPMRREGDLDFACDRCGGRYTFHTQVVPDEWYQTRAEDAPGLILEDARLPICQVCKSAMFVFTGCLRRHHRWVIFHCKARPAEHRVEAYSLRVPDAEWCELLGGRDVACMMVLAELLAQDVDIDPLNLCQPQEMSLSGTSEEQVRECMFWIEYLRDTGLIHDVEFTNDSIRFNHDKEFIANLVLALGNKTRA